MWAWYYRRLAWADIKHAKWHWFSREFHSENDIQYSEKEIFEKDTVTAADLKETENTGANDTAYGEYILQTVTTHKDELDAIIQTYAKGWDIARLNNTDKNIMRLALCELVYPKEEMAPSIILNEAIVLAKEYSGETSARFINGVLGAYVRSRS